MKLKVIRKSFTEEYTIGKLYIDDMYFCDTLEDKVRDLQKEQKVFGQTAIPYGKYKFIINYSEHFKRSLPLLLNVPNFEGVRIHAGNFAKDTEGCLLVGENKIKGQLVNSKVTFDKLFDILTKSGLREFEIEYVK